MLDDQVIRVVLEVVVGAKREIIVLLFRAGVNPTALIAVERPFGIIAGDDVLTPVFSV